MIVTIVEVFVKEDRIEDFKRATIENHQSSIKGPGNLRFDVLQCTDNPARFTLYEGYQTKEDADTHKKTAHYLKWREVVADWMAAPRNGIHHQVIAPEEIELWK